MKTKLSLLSNTVLCTFALISTVGVMAAPSADGIVIYNAQHETLTKAWVDAFTQETGIKVTVRNGGDTELGNQIVLQGGTMKNDAVVRAFEQLTGVTVHRSNISEMMGAYGCALYSKNAGVQGSATLDGHVHVSSYTDEQLQCKGCENNCYIKKYLFTYPLCRFVTVF